MTEVTDPDLMPYGVGTDYADVQQWFDLAMKVDGYAQQADQRFDQLYRPPSFIFANNAAQPIGAGVQTAFFPAWNTTLWNNSNFRISQFGNPGAPLTGELEWWLFGAWLPIINTGGSAVVGGHIVSYFSGSYNDPITGAVQGTHYGPTANNGQYSGYQKVFESNGGIGERLTMTTLVPMLGGAPSVVLSIFAAAGDTATRSLAAGALFWGIRIGEVVI